MTQSKRRTIKNRKPTQPFRATIVETFLGILNTVKLYHWNTHSYAKHKATDDLYSLLNEHIDKFVEIMMGKDEKRIPGFSKKIVNDPKSNFKARIYEYREFLIDLPVQLQNIVGHVLSLAGPQGRRTPLHAAHGGPVMRLTDERLVIQKPL